MPRTLWFVRHTGGASCIRRWQLALRSSLSFWPLSFQLKIRALPKQRKGLPALGPPQRRCRKPECRTDDLLTD